MTGASDAGRAGRGGRTKSGKPRPGTGGYGRRRLEGKGPTPPAHMRPGHPAQRRAAAAAAAEKDSGRGRGQGDSGQPGRRGGRDAAPQAVRADGWRPAADRRAGDLAGAERGRRQRGAGEAPEIVAGLNAVLEALRAGVPASSLHAAPRAGGEREREVIALAASAGVPMIETGRAELDRITGGAIHQGVALRLRPYEYAAPEDLVARARLAGQAPLLVALDNVTDPRNLGAIVRSVAAFGGHGVVIPSRRSARVTAGAWKASAGALASVPVALAGNLTRTLVSYRESGLFVVGLDAAGEVDVADLDISTEPLVLVVGSEGRGLSRLVAQRCDLIAAIPIATESLNAGVAAGIALHEVAVRRARAA